MEDPEPFHRQLQEALEAVRNGRPLAPRKQEAARPAMSRMAAVAKELDADRRREAPAGRATRTPSGKIHSILKATPAKTELEKAWEELNRPLPPEEPPADDARYQPKG